RSDRSAPSSSTSDHGATSSSISERSAPVSISERSAPVSISERSAPVSISERSAPSTSISERSAPVSMQPSGPVPKLDDKLADGSGPAKVPRNPVEALQAWAGVIETLEQQRRMSLRGYFEFARVLAWTQSEVQLGFAADDDSRWAGENAAEKASLDEL